MKVALYSVVKPEQKKILDGQGKVGTIDISGLSGPSDVFLSDTERTFIWSEKILILS